MAANEQGTGHHKHKSTEEPYSHNEAPTTSGKSSGQQASERQSGGEGKGSSGGGRQESGSSRSHESGSSSRSSQGGNDADLRAREYTGPDGEQHHHTKTYMEQHKGESGGSSEKGGKKSAA